MINYTAKYDSDLLRGTDNPRTSRPWDITSLLMGLGRKENFLDVGCGTAFKLIPLAENFENMYCLDISQSMLKGAVVKLRKSGINNADFILADSNKMPFKNNFFDAITCMLSRWNINELSRVMKSDASLIIEDIGCEDKKEFKLFFGKDKLGYRGQFIDYHREAYIDSYKEKFSAYFYEVKVVNGYWETHYTEQGILELLGNTPTIRGFSNNDLPLAMEAINHFNDNGVITLKQNRILINAKYPKK